MGSMVDASLIRCICLFYLREDKQRKELPINHEAMTASVVVSTLGLAHSYVVGVCFYVCMRKNKGAHGLTCESVCQPATLEEF